MIEFDNRDEGKAMTKVKIPLGIVILMVIALGYVLGMESGRERRDAIVVGLGRQGGDIVAAPSDAESAPKASASDRDG